MVIDGHWGGEFVAVYFSEHQPQSNAFYITYYPRTTGVCMFMRKHAIVYILHNVPNRSDAFNKCSSCEKLLVVYCPLIPQSVYVTCFPESRNEVLWPWHAALFSHLSSIVNESSPSQTGCAASLPGSHAGYFMALPAELIKQAIDRIRLDERDVMM